MSEIILVVIALLLLAGAALGATKTGVFNTMDTAQMNQWNNLCIAVAEESQNLSPQEVKAIIGIESSGNPNASNPNDPSYGLMGIEFWVGQQYGGASQVSDLYTPALNVTAGSGFLDYLKGKYASRFPLGQGSGWVQMYNLGETKFLAGERVPDYESKFISYSSQFASDFASGS